MRANRRDDVLAEVRRVGRGVSTLRVAWAIGATTNCVRVHLKALEAEGLVSSRCHQRGHPVVWTARYECPACNGKGTVAVPT